MKCHQVRCHFQVVVPLVTYREQFQEMKGRVDRMDALRVLFDRCSSTTTRLDSLSLQGGLPGQGAGGYSTCRQAHRCQVTRQ